MKVLKLFLLITIVIPVIHGFERRDVDGSRGKPHPTDKDPQMYPSNVWIVHVKPGTDPLETARNLGLRYVRSMPGQENVYAFESYTGGTAHHLVGKVASEDPAVVQHNRQFMTRKYRREAPVRFAGGDHHFLVHKGDSLNHHKRDYNPNGAMPHPFAVNDPLFTDQWHLRGDSEININVQDAWGCADDARGNGAVIAIVDDGFQRSHPDLSSNYRGDLSYDYNGNDSDPNPYPGDGHGTSAAGVAAAGANSKCGVGVCPECGLAGIKLIGGPTSDYLEAVALNRESNQIAIYSNSWGPYDDGSSLSGPGPSTRASIENGAINGRSGLGNIYVWAGGNGGQYGDNGNYDGYANSRFTIAVGAVGFNSIKAYYSEPCACLMVTAPSSGFRGRSITTTDLMGSDGYSTTDCTSTFGGTSAAAPIVAGVTGLLLGKYPTLTRRDILHILAITSTQIDTKFSNWTPRNARKISHSHDYGWGLVDASAAMMVGMVWTPVPTERVCSTGVQNLSIEISDAGYRTFHPTDMPTLSCLQTDGHEIDFVEYVTLTIWMTHGRRGDVEISLIDPAGVKSDLSLVHDDYTANYPSEGWTFGSARHWGQTMEGQWTVSLDDARRNGIGGTLTGMELNIYGHKTTA